MNQIPRRDPYAEEIARIREVVRRHILPNFVTGFDVRLGDFDGDPAMWITFETRADQDSSRANRTHRAQILGHLRKAVQSDLLETFDQRFPYFRFIARDFEGTARH